MDGQLVELLLNRNESESLDFKAAQYPFNGASDSEKAELVKDILAMANAWRSEDAYILIGVTEVKGGRSIVNGVAHHLEDSNVQQLVNSKTDQPVRFSYEAFSFENLPMGILHIPVQDRPRYLTRDFGGLKKDLVYIRRGSSTEVAATPEIVKMVETRAKLPSREERVKRLLERARDSGEPVVILDWQGGKGNHNMRSVLADSVVTAVNEHSACFQTKHGNPLSRPLENIQAHEDSSGQLRIDLYL